MGIAWKSYGGVVPKRRQISQDYGNSKNRVIYNPCDKRDHSNYDDRVKIWV